jgi:hypothetical protein
VYLPVYSTIILPAGLAGADLRTEALVTYPATSGSHNMPWHAKRVRGASPRCSQRSITSAVPMNLGNQYQNYLFIRSTDCKARPFGTNWQARYSDEEPYMYSVSTPGDFSGEILANLRE